MTNRLKDYYGEPCECDEPLKCPHCNNCLNCDLEGQREQIIDAAPTDIDQCSSCDYKEKKTKIICEAQRLMERKTFCQKPKGHEGKCMAVIFWESKKEEKVK